MVTARRLAETFRAVVMVLTDANLATGVQPFPRPELDVAWQALPPDLGPVPEGARPFDWDPRTGLSKRFVPGSRGGCTPPPGLAHDERSKVAYTSDVNQRGMPCAAASSPCCRACCAAGGERRRQGDLLVVGWGSTKGAIEEAVERARAEGCASPRCTCASSRRWSRG
jgi:2-oxoglutarate/2-oxoacid ferredoxin oxidoreductase subunit alpha